MDRTVNCATPTQSPRGIRNGPALIAAGAVAVVLIIALAGAFTIDLLTGIVVDGGVALLWSLAAAGLSPVRFAGTAERAGQTLLRCITHVALGLGGIGLIYLLLGLVGLLDRTTVLTVLVIGVGLFVFRFRKHTGSARSMLRTWLAERDWIALAWPVLAAWLALGLVCVSIAPGFLWKPLDPHPYDVMSYHLQVPREWFDARRIIPLEHNAFSFFPMAMEVHYLAAMHLWGGPWAGMYLCQMLTLLHGLLAVVTVIGAAEALGAPRRFAILGGLLAAAVPWTLMLSTVCYVEAGVMLYTILAFAWAAVAMRQAEKPSVLVCSFACAGLACGFKYTSFALVAAPLVVAWPVVALVSRRLTVTQTLRRALPAIGCMVIVVSPWLVRNVVWTGNPVFPLATSVFGQAHFTDEQVARYTLAHRPPEAEASIGQRIVKGFERTVIDPQFGFVLIPLALGASLLIARRAEGALLVVLMAAMTSVWLLATHVMPRFLTPMTPVMALACVLAAGMLARRATVATGSALTGATGVTVLTGAWAVMGGLGSTLPLAQQGLFRLPDYTLLEASEVTNAKARGFKLALVGECQAFFYDVPSGHLLYRTVFDLHDLGTDPAELSGRWLGKPIDALQREGYLVIENVDERERLRASYRLTNAPGQGGGAGIVYHGPMSAGQ